MPTTDRSMKTIICFIRGYEYGASLASPWTMEVHTVNSFSYFSLRNLKQKNELTVYIYTVSQKNCANYIFIITLANVGRFLKFFQCRNQKEMAHNKNEKFPTVA